MRFTLTLILAASLAASNSALELEGTSMAAVQTQIDPMPTIVNCANPVSIVQADTNLLSLNARAYEPQTVTIQLYGENNVARTSGGDSPIFRLEERCATSVSEVRCMPTNNGGTASSDFPIEGPMTDNGDGTYSYTFTTPAGGANEALTVSASISVLTAGGLFAEFYDNKERTGEPVGTRTENPNNNYGSGPVGLSGDNNLVGASWTGKLCAPTTEAHTFYVRSNDSFMFSANDVMLMKASWNGTYLN